MNLLKTRKEYVTFPLNPSPIFPATLYFVFQILRVKHAVSEKQTDNVQYVPCMRACVYVPVRCMCVCVRARHMRVCPPVWCMCVCVRGV